jgi:alkanesulfonate monooxygenase SsuD/methylene tetrahydromethanopterin reductase-like flavin-dependent oxidoreductase (luciferase family)
LGARRPIIVFGPQNSVMRDIIRRHRLGWFASNVDEAQEALRAAYARFTAGTYELTVDSRVFPTANDLAQRFAQVLDGALDPSAQHYAARTAVRS